MMDMISIAKKQSLSNNKTPILKSGERPLSASNKKLMTSADQNVNEISNRKNGFFGSFSRNDLMNESLNMGTHAPDRQIC